MVDSSSVHRDLAWEQEGNHFGCLSGPGMECGLVTGEMPVPLPGTAEVPSSKALNPQLPGAPVHGYGGNAKVVHFLGKTKPWSYTFDPKSKQMAGSVHEATGHPTFLVDWWIVFSSAVVPMLQEQYGDRPFYSGCVEFRYSDTVTFESEQGSSSSSFAQELEPQVSSEERKQKWEQGQADYMGMDSFDNIKRKLDTFLK